VKELLLSRRTRIRRISKAAARSRGVIYCYYYYCVRASRTSFVDEDVEDVEDRQSRASGDAKER
jgi:hypothetical protein